MFTKIQPSNDKAPAVITVTSCKFSHRMDRFRYSIGSYEEAYLHM